MAVSDALVVGEGWISEHYFGTDARSESFHARVLARRKEWDEQRDHGTVRSRVSAARSELLDAFATIEAAPADEVAALAGRLFTILGYADLGRVSETTGPVDRVRAAGLEGGADLAVVRAQSVGSVDELMEKDAQTLLEPFVVDEKDQIVSVARLLSTLFFGEDPPAFALVLAGRSLLVAERERWPEGRYLFVDLQLVLERNDDKKGGEVDRALTCVSAESLAPNAEGSIWWAETLEESRRHTVGVSQDLRDGVRLSIEIIANEVVHRRQDQGLEPLSADEAQPLAKQSLRFLYRILFLLYAESSPELGVLPSGDAAYDTGYSLDRLRDLTLVDLLTEQARSGTHLYESLAVLFGLVDRGHDGGGTEGEAAASIEGLKFRGLRADVFRPAATAHIDEVRLGNEALQHVLKHLLLSKEVKGKDRGFISYAELGINQLGAVYEGLMSYTGLFAETDLYEVARGGDASKGSWIVPTDRVDGIAQEDFVTVEDSTGQPKPVLHKRGSFVFRLAGRERQQSASYYTPEVLTKFVVSQALEELLDQDGVATTAEGILGMTICEPALGSGAFAIEAVRQLAEAYLQRRQDETGERIDPDEYPRELQRVKAYMALHQVYGVDLNATAVELAEISLWLDTMVEGLDAPWFGLHLRRGNSLVGARKAVYRRDQAADKGWLKAVPVRVRPDGLGDPGEDTVDRISGRVPHFLLPAEGWGAAADVAKDIQDLVPDEVAAIKEWRKAVKAKPAKKDLDRLVALGERVERLWELAERRLDIADQQIRREIPLWGQPETVNDATYVTREQIEESLADLNGAYRRLRLVMDAWCALWFWPLTETNVALPTLHQWLDAQHQILGTNTVSAKVAKRGDDTFADVDTWDELADAEENDRIFAGAKRVEEVLTAHPWLTVCQQISDQQGFFHWELEFAPVFRRGGFDLQVGNPPWVRPRTDVEALLAEGDPWWELAHKASEKDKRSRRDQTLELPGIRDSVVGLTGDVVVMARYFADPQYFPLLANLQPDLYRCFMVMTFEHQSSIGITSLIHPESHLTEERAGRLRGVVYQRLRRHWQFINELKLFEIHNLVTYGTHVYGKMQQDVQFLQAASLYHPDTLVRSIGLDDYGPEPGFKDESGKWNLRPHGSRVTEVTDETLATWHRLLESPESSPSESRMVYSINRSAARVLERLAASPRVAAIPLEFTRGWDESTDRKKGFFKLQWGRAESWQDVIIQGPSFFVANTFNKSPNESMTSNKDWINVDLEALGRSAVPVTAYKPSGDRKAYDLGFTHWGNDRSSPARSFYRVVWRAMAANTGERTLIPTIVPPGTAHIHTVESLAHLEEPRVTVLLAGTLSSLVSDFLVRSVPKSALGAAVVRRLAFVRHSLEDELILRVLRLNCLTAAYSDLWESVIGTASSAGDWAGGLPYAGRPRLNDVRVEWSEDSPIRRTTDRRQALVEIDALVALVLGVSIEELCTIYRTQFSVMVDKDCGRSLEKYIYDANGRQVPHVVVSAYKAKGEQISHTERTHVHPESDVEYTYVLPFVTLDREADMRQAYAHFEKVLAERSDG